MILFYIFIFCQLAGFATLSPSPVATSSGKGLGFVIKAGLILNFLSFLYF